MFRLNSLSIRPASLLANIVSSFDGTSLASQISYEFCFSAILFQNDEPFEIPCFSRFYTFQTQETISLQDMIAYPLDGPYPPPGSFVQLIMWISVGPRTLLPLAFCSIPIYSRKSYLRTGVKTTPLQPFSQTDSLPPSCLASLIIISRFFCDSTVLLPEKLMKFIEERSSDVLTLLPEPIFSSLTISTHLENSVPIHSSTTFPSFSNKPEEQDEIFQVDDLMFGSSYHSPWNTLPFITTDAALSLIQPSLRFSKNRRECDSWIDQIRSSKSPLPQHPSHSKAIPAVPWMDEITIKSTDYISSKVPQITAALIALQVEFLKVEIPDMPVDLLSAPQSQQHENQWYQNMKTVSTIDSLGSETIPLHLRFPSQEVDKLLHTISLYPPLDIISRRDQDFLWEHRYLAAKYPSLLYPFIQSVAWDVPSKHNEALMIIETWRKPTLSCIFEILSHPTWDNDSVLRLYAIKHLSELPNEELLDYLPQLTQSLIYDPIWDSSRDRLKHVKSQETKAVPPQTARQKTQTTPVSPSQKEYTSDLTSIQSHSTSTSIDKLHQSKSFTGTVGNIQTHLDAMGTPLKVTGGRPTTSQSFSVNPTSSSYVGDGPRRESDQQTNEAMSEFESSTTSGRSNQGYSFTYDNVGKHVGLESDTDQVSVGAISAEDSARSDFTTERDRFDSEPHTESTQYRPPQPPSSINTGLNLARRLELKDPQKQFLNHIKVDTNHYNSEKPLTTFLFERASKNVEIFCLLYWNLHVMKEIENDSKTTLTILNELFAFIYKAAPTFLVFIYRQVLLLQKIQTAFEKTAGIPRQERIERMKIEAQDFFSPNEPFPSPVNPNFWLSHIFPDKISIFKSKVLPVLARFKADSTDTALESLVVDHGDRSTEWRSVEELNGKFGITQAMIDLSLARLREREERGQKLVSDEMIELAKREEEKERLAQQNKKEEEKDHNTLTEPLSQTEPIIADDAIPETLPTKNTTYDSSHPAQPRSSISDQTDSLEMNKERSIVPTHKQNLKGTGYDDTVISENDDLIFEPIEGEHHYDPAPLDSFVPPVELGIDEDSSQPEPSPYSPPTSSQMDLTRPAPIAPPSMPQIVLQGAKPSPPRRDDEQRRPGNQVEESNHSFMYKSLDDVRQDMLCVQIVSVFDRLFKSENLDLKLSPYQVVAIGANPPLGLIEFVPSKSIERIKLEDQSIANYFRSHNRDDSSPLGYPPEVLDNFIRSCAGYSVITFLLTVGDRHLDNLLVTPDGKMFHVDFGMFLGHDVKFRPSPMKLSKEMIDCMGGIESSHFGRFISLCCEAYSIARRKGANLILSLFRMMRKAKIPDLEDARGLTLVLMKFKLELTETEANYYMVQQIGKSTSAFFPSMVDKIHIFAQSWRN